MKRFCIKILLFLSIVIVIDIFAGIGFENLRLKARGGNTMRNNIIWNLGETDILVFGSSRAVHHYNTPLISNKLGVTAYNCGQDGNGIIYHYARFQYLKDKTHPKIVIYDVTPAFDLLKGTDNHRYLGGLKPYYAKPGVAEVFKDIDKTEIIKMKSSLYQYNSMYLQLLNDYALVPSGIQNDGFEPIDKNLDEMQIGRQNFAAEFDSKKIDYIKRFIDEGSSARLIFIVSPTWYGINEELLKPIQEICKEEGIEYINYSNDPYFLHNNDLFSDGQHLNSKGAELFTRKIIEFLTKKS